MRLEKEVTEMRDRRSAYHRFLFVALLIVSSVATGPACRSRGANETPPGLIIISAPVTGVVRRVLVSEGAQINEGATIMEIALQPESSTTHPSTDDSRDQARAEIAGAQSETAAAEAETRRAAIELQRVQALVRDKQASQPELDAARAVYQRAQERFERAKDIEQAAQKNLTIQEGRSNEQNNSSQPGETVVVVKASSSGNVRVISVRAGQRVTAGQPVVTLMAVK